MTSRHTGWAHNECSYAAFMGQIVKEQYVITCFIKHGMKSSLNGISYTSRIDPGAAVV